jgi:hypothetical protein
MTQKPLVQTKALSAYFQSRGSSLAVALAQVGITDRLHLDSETLSDDIIGKIARRYGLTPERLAALAADEYKA